MNVRLRTSPSHFACVCVPRPSSRFLRWDSLLSCPVFFYDSFWSIVRYGCFSQVIVMLWTPIMCYNQEEVRRIVCEAHIEKYWQHCRSDKLHICMQVTRDLSRCISDKDHDCDSDENTAVCNGKWQRCICVQVTKTCLRTSDKDIHCTCLCTSEEDAIYMHTLVRKTHVYECKRHIYVQVAKTPLCTYGKDR